MEEEVKTEALPEKSNDEVLKKINDVLNMNEIAELINSNEKIFDFNGVTYRVKKPNYSQKQEVYKKRVEKYVEMLKDEKCLLDKDLRELYKKRNVDIDDMESQIKTQTKRRDEFMIKLGGEIKQNAGDPTLKELKKEIDELNAIISTLSIKKSTLLEFSIEQQLTIYLYTYFVYLLAEKKDGENWVRVWNTYEEFVTANNQELINQFSYYVTVMVGIDGL